MFVYTVFVAIVAFAGMSAASDEPSYGPLVPKYVPIQLVADPLLNQLLNSLDNLESREASQLSKLDVVIKEANQNSEFVNRFNEVILSNIEFQQKQQNQRLDDLEAKIAQIQALRVNAQNLQAAASVINDQINNVVYPDRKKIMYDISDLQNIALEQNANIQETQQRADDVSDRIDALVEKAWANTRALLVLDSARKDVTQEVNVQNSGAAPVVHVAPNTENSTYTFAFPVAALGAPSVWQPQIVGFYACKQFAYQKGYPSLYFGLSTTVDNDNIAISSVDTSSGGWVVKYIFTKAGFTYLSTQKLSLK